MLIDFHSSTKKDDWPFEVVIDLSKSSPRPEKIDDWEFDLEWQSRVGRDVTKIKVTSKRVDATVRAKGQGIFHVQFSGSFECDLTSLNNSTQTLQVANVYFKRVGGKKTKLSPNTEFNWGRSGVMIYKTKQ